MKRTILSLMLVFSLIICLCGCVSSDNQEIYDRFNGFSKDVSKYSIEICVTSPSGNKVTETYDVTVEGASRTVNYRIEKLNTITVDGDEITVPEDYVSVSQGTLHSAAEGQDTYALPNFQFSDRALENFKRNTASFPYSFSADVVSLKDFMGIDLNATDITLTGGYLISNFSYITVAYATANGNTVTVTYTYK